MPQAGQQDQGGGERCPRCHNEELLRGGYCIICGMPLGEKREGLPPESGGKTDRK